MNVFEYRLENKEAGQRLYSGKESRSSTGYLYIEISKGRNGIHTSLWTKYLIHTKIENDFILAEETKVIGHFTILPRDREKEKDWNQYTLLSLIATGYWEDTDDAKGTLLFEIMKNIDITTAIKKEFPEWYDRFGNTEEGKNDD